MTSFEDISYGFGQSSHSPELTSEDPQGIKIAVLPRFVFSAPPVADSPDEIPLSVDAKLSGLVIARFDQLFKEIKVVLVDDEHGAVFTGGVWRDRHYVPQGHHLSHAELAVSTFYKYSTVNLLEFFPLPRRSATYNIHAVLEEYTSNVATMRVEAP